MIILPEGKSLDKFVQYDIDSPYLAIQISQLGYISLSETTENALKVPSLYARWIQRYSINKDLPVPLVYSSRIRTNINYATGSCSSTIKNPQ
jgi:hypothetical protein